MYQDAVNSDPGMILILVPLALYWGYKKDGMRGVLKTLAALIVGYIFLMLVMGIGAVIIGLVIEYFGAVLIGIMFILLFANMHK